MRRLTFFLFAALLSLLAAQASHGQTLVPKSKVKSYSGTTTKSVPRRVPVPAPEPAPIRTAPVARPAAPVAPAPQQPSAINDLEHPSNILPKRKPASTDRAVVTSRIKYKSHVEYGAYRQRFWLGLVGGQGSLSSSDATTQGVRSGNDFDKNMIVGINADLRFHRNYGMELEGYYGLSGTQTLDYQNGITDATSIRHLGGVAIAKGEYPFYSGSVHIVPKLGLGYGMMQLTNKVDRTDASGTENLDQKMSVSGFCAEVGFEIEPVRDVIFSADYLMSLMASGKITGITGAGDLDGPGFSRIRAGLYYRLLSSLVIGAQYNQRTLKTTSALASAVDGGIKGNESMSQIIGAVFYEFQ